MHFLEPDDGPVLVGDLDADGVLARNRRDDADARHLQVQGEVVGQAGDLVDAQAGLQGDLVLRDDRAGVDADDVDVQPEVGERLFQQRGRLAQVLIVLLVAGTAAGLRAASAAAARSRRSVGHRHHGRGRAFGCCNNLRRRQCRGDGSPGDELEFRFRRVFPRSGFFFCRFFAPLIRALMPKRLLA